MKKKLRWGLVGYGKAAKNFYNTFDTNLSSELVSISTKSKYDEISCNLKNLEIYKNYEDQIQSNKIDIIYISLINPLHKKLMELGIKYNKHIIIEKPSCLSFFDLNIVISKIKNKNIFFKESILYLNHPLIKKVKKILIKIGEIKNINSSYGFNFAKKNFFFFKRKKKYEENIFNKNLGGGAIYNYAHYPLSAVNIFSQNQKPKNSKIIKCKSFIGHTGVDEFSNIILEFDNGIKSSITVAINKNLKSFIEIIGSKGKIFINNPWVPNQSFSFNLYLSNKSEKEFIFNSIRSMWSYEIESIENDIFNNKLISSTPGASLEDSCFYLKQIDKWRSQVYNK